MRRPSANISSGAMDGWTKRTGRKLFARACGSEMELVNSSHRTLSFFQFLFQDFQRLESRDRSFLNTGDSLSLFNFVLHGAYVSASKYFALHFFRKFFKVLAQITHCAFLIVSRKLLLQRVVEFFDYAHSALSRSMVFFSVEKSRMRPARSCAMKPGLSLLPYCWWNLSTSVPFS